MRDLTPLIDRLLQFAPDTPEAEQEQQLIESALMRALGEGGKEAGEELVGSLAEHGYALERLDALPCMWRVRIPEPLILELWFTGGETPVVAALSYRVGTPWGTADEKQAAKLQAAFYARYEELCAPGTEVAAMSPEDQLILRVAELEADVNNGGFGQYLDNKGEDRGRKALVDLKAIGARRTADWLSSALDAPGDPALLENLDQQFVEKPDDLPSLVMRYLDAEGGSS